MTNRSLVILGSTGSIGTQALDVVRRFPGELQVEALSARANWRLLLEQTREFKPLVAHLADAEGAERLAEALAGTRTRVLSGPDALCEVAAEVPCDLVAVATVGWTGVEPTLAAIEAGREIALANKEVLVCAGDLVMEAARARGLTIWPLDSEHNAIMQAFSAGPPGPLAPIRRIILTCSGGPFRNASAETMQHATARETLDHPTWEMGRKITVDSATQINKGFEVIEAHHLFQVPYEKIEVVIHPQSIVHSIVEFVDGSMIAQMGATDMRLPIQNVLTHPSRRESATAPINLARIGALEFQAPDFERFPCLRMAYESGRKGGTVPCVLNAVNEVAVAAHLDGEISYGGIARLIERVLATHESLDTPNLDALREADRWARMEAIRVLGAITSNSAASSPNAASTQL